MPKIIEFDEPTGLKCDAPRCGFEDPTVTRDMYPRMIDAPCPKCGANLLTNADMRALLALERAAKWINRLLGWLRWFDRRPLKNIGGYHFDGSGRPTHVKPR